MKITMYELLGMIKDDKAPKKIKYENRIYELTNKKIIWADEIYYIENNDNISLNFKHIKSMNDEVEIIEEDKKIEKLDIKQEKNIKNNWKWKCNGYCISTPQKLIGDKVNELIDEVNRLKEK